MDREQEVALFIESSKEPGTALDFLQGLSAWELAWSFWWAVLVIPGAIFNHKRDGGSFNLANRYLRKLYEVRHGYPPKIDDAQAG